MRLRFVWIPSLAFTTALVVVACNPAIIAAGGTGGDADSDAGSGAGSGGGDVCDYLGTFYALGTSWPANTGCGNTCSCTARGIVCTLLSCNPDGGGNGGGNTYPDGGGDGGGSTYPDGGNTFPDGGNTFPDGGGSTFPDGGGPNGCFFDGLWYFVGQSFPAPDGCNTCVCQIDGDVACSDVACDDDGGAPPPVDAGATGFCFYDGVDYQAGQSFPAADGCNVCACTDDGGVICTTFSCSDGGF